MYAALCYEIRSRPHDIFRVGGVDRGPSGTDFPSARRCDYVWQRLSEGGVLCHALALMASPCYNRGLPCSMHREYGLSAGSRGLGRDGPVTGVSRDVGQRLIRQHL